MGNQIITVEHDIASIKVFLDKLATEAVKKAVATAIRRTFTGLKTNLSKEIRSRKLVNPRTLPARILKSRYIRESQKISASMPISDMEAKLSFSDRKISAMHFWAKRVAVYRSTSKGKKKRATSRGNKLSAVQLNVMGKNELAAGGKGFMPGTTGVRTVFIRKTIRRTPIRIVVGPSLAFMVDKLGLVSSLQKYSRERYAEEFANQFEYYLKQLTERQQATSGK